MRKKFESKYSYQFISSLRSLFLEKGWTGADDFENFFNKFCSSLELHNEKQTVLVVELTKEFLWVRVSDYYKYLKAALLKLGNYGKLDLSTVYIHPMMTNSAREKNKVKSSGLVAYLCKNHELRNTTLFENTNFVIIENPELLPSPRKVRDSRIPIIVIDDFVGSGDTALEALSEIFEIKSYDKEFVFIASLVCQEEGVKRINDFGLEVLTDTIRKKGISDKFSGEYLKLKKDLMNSIEDILSLDERFKEDSRFGYKTSEALVSMNRTPNNTFPLYWFEAKLGKGNVWVPPFKR